MAANNEARSHHLGADLRRLHGLMKLYGIKPADIERRASVAKATVSTVLGGGGSQIKISEVQEAVEEIVREKKQQAAEEHLDEELDGARVNGSRDESQGEGCQRGHRTEVRVEGPSISRSWRVVMVPDHSDPPEALREAEQFALEAVERMTKWGAWPPPEVIDEPGDEGE